MELCTLVGSLLAQRTSFRPFPFSQRFKSNSRLERVGVPVLYALCEGN